MELIPENPERLAEDGIGNRQFDVFLQGLFEECQRLAAKLESGDVDVAVGCDPIHLAPTLFASPVLHGAVDHLIDLLF